MRRVLFHLWGVPVYSYPAMLYVGIVLGIYAELLAAGAAGLDRPRILAATLILLTSALLGARLLFVATHWEIYRGRPRRILHFADGGASMYGGLLLALPFSVVLLRALGVPFGTFWDVASFTMIIGLVVTRFGCFLNGCCAGRSTCGPLGMDLTDYHGIRTRRIPTQLLEAAWGLVVTGGASLAWGRLPFHGGVFLVTLAAYGAGRIVLETTRDEQDRLLGLTLHRALSMVFVVVAVVAVTLAWWG